MNDISAHVDEARFLEILAGMTARIPQPARVTGRPRLPLADMVFICVYRTYTNLSSRRFKAKLEAMYSAGIVGIDCHRNSICNYLRDPKLTPILENLVETTSTSLGPFKTEAAAEAAVTFMADKFGSAKRPKDDQALENENLCSVLCLNIVELVERGPQEEVYPG